MTGKELIKQLKRQGWTLDRITGSNHIMIKGKEIMSVPVHDNKNLPKGILTALLRQGGLK